MLGAAIASPPSGSNTPPNAAQTSGTGKGCRLFCQLTPTTRSTRIVCCDAAGCCAVIQGICSICTGCAGRHERVMHFCAGALPRRANSRRQAWHQPGSTQRWQASRLWLPGTALNHGALSTASASSDSYGIAGEANFIETDGTIKTSFAVNTCDARRWLIAQTMGKKVWMVNAYMHDHDQYQISVGFAVLYQLQRKLDIAPAVICQRYFQTPFR